MFTDDFAIGIFDHCFLSKEEFFNILPYVLELEDYWEVDLDSSVYTKFLCKFNGDNKKYAVITNTAWIDNASTFHTFELKKSYVLVNHPELLL
jgi:hypothetical protein